MIGFFIIGLSTILFAVIFYQSEKIFINYIELIAGVVTVISVVLVAYRSKLNYFFGIIAVILYGYIAYVFTNTGEWMLNWIIYLPLNIIGIMLWRSKINNKQVIVKKLSKKYFLFIIILLILCTNLYAIFLLHSQELFYGKMIHQYHISKFYIDAFTTISSIFAMILMILRFKEQWILWILINIFTIILWCITFNITMIVMWSTLLLNSLYGYYNWNKNNT